MIYRVHNPFDDYGDRGSEIGYVSLCYGHITSGHIVDALRQVKLIPEKWFLHTELTYTNHMMPPEYHGIQAMSLIKRQGRKCILYLEPIKSAATKTSPFILKPSSWKTLEFGQVFATTRIAAAPVVAAVQAPAVPVADPFAIANIDMVEPVGWAPRQRYNAVAPQPQINLNYAFQEAGPLPVAVEPDAADVFDEAPVQLDIDNEPF